MEKVVVLYNPLSGNANEQAVKEAMPKFYEGKNLEYVDVTTLADMKAFVQENAGNYVVLVGGDGTLNRFINATDGLRLTNIYYYAMGSGNDFAHDISYNVGDAPVCIDKYLVNLPTVEVQGKKYKFINGVGYGIDGYCCEVGDAQKAKGITKVNYTSIAIKGLLFHYKPCNAIVIVDGKEYFFKKVWIAPTMLGRYYGGGMMPTPQQDRLNEQGLLSICIMGGRGKLGTLIVFPNLFKGEHVKDKSVTILSGKSITVKFTRPTACQIDGETVLGVTELTSTSWNL